MQIPKLSYRRLTPFSGADGSKANNENVENLLPNPKSIRIVSNTTEGKKKEMSKYVEILWGLAHLARLLQGMSIRTRVLISTPREHLEMYQLGSVLLHFLTATRLRHRF